MLCLNGTATLQSTTLCCLEPHRQQRKSNYSSQPTGVSATVWTPEKTNV